MKCEMKYQHARKHNCQTIRSKIFLLISPSPYFASEKLAILGKTHHVKYRKDVLKDYLRSITSRHSTFYHIRSLLMILKWGGKRFRKHYRHDIE